MHEEEMWYAFSLVLMLKWIKVTELYGSTRVIVSWWGNGWGKDQIRNDLKGLKDKKDGSNAITFKLGDSAGII